MTKLDTDYFAPAVLDSCVDSIIQAAQIRAGILHNCRENILTINESKKQVDHLLTQYQTNILQQAMVKLETTEEFRQAKGIIPTIREIRLSIAEKQAMEAAPSFIPTAHPFTI